LKGKAAQDGKHAMARLVGEQPVTVTTKRRFSRLEWQKLRERNEALDRLDVRILTRISIAASVSPSVDVSASFRSPHS
jgi:hypothetical protein